MNSRSKQKVNQLRDVLQTHKTMLIVMQDNPDPDSLASAAALRRLSNTLAEMQCSIASGGVIGRGENRALVQYLNLNIRPIHQLDLTNFELVAMVDTQPQTGNNSLPAYIEPDIVIDHHLCRHQTRQCPFTDIRCRYGATSTILYEYLKAAQLDIDPPLATALLYGIRSDTQDLGRDACKADLKALQDLYRYANSRMLSRIQRGQVQRNYFQMLYNALHRAIVYGRAIVVSLGQIDNPDIVAEVADLLLRDESTNWVMAYGFYADKMMISLRTEQDAQPADKIIRRLVARRGYGGGHPSYAGGQIPIDKLPDHLVKALEKLLVERFIRLTGNGQATPEPLIETKP